MVMGGTGQRMRRLAIAVAACAVAGTACAAECPGNPDAIGTSRTIYVDPAEHPRVGTMQYHETLPLNDHEIVLSFDDGPLPPKSTRVLDILAAECVRVTFFSVGRMAEQFPAVLRRAHAEGHSIGTHTQNHPIGLRHRVTADNRHQHVIHRRGPGPPGHHPQDQPRDPESSSHVRTDWPSTRRTPAGMFSRLP